MKQFSYYSNVRNEIIDKVPSNIHTLLDIGCGSGNFGVAAKKIKNISEVWGVEINPVAGELAKNNIDKVIIQSVDKIYELLPDNYFDCICFNDVLEHLIDPENVLEQLKNKLSPQGVIIASIPNVRYYDNLKELLFKKDWEYKPEGGILDSTHLKFFTKKSIIRMFKQTGYKVDSITGINPITSYIKLFIIHSFIGFINDTKYMQFLIIAKKDI